MRYSSLIFTSLALSYSVANAASDSTLTGDIVHIPHIMYDGKMYDVKMKYNAPDNLVLQTVTPLQTAPSNPAVNVSDKLKFKLIGVDVNGQAYRADIKHKDGKYTVSGIGLALHGKMLKGEKITALGWIADGSYSYAYGISEDGQSITGRSRTADKRTAPIRFHYDRAEIEVLNGQAGKNDVSRAINNNGVIAGYGNVESDKKKPAVYNAFYNKSGKNLVNLGTLGGKDSRAYGINNNGTVVGWSASKGDNSDHVAFGYDGTTMQALGANILGGERSFAFDINDSNQITGVALTSDGSALAFIYENGTTKSLGSLDNSGYSEARAINNKGHITGWSLSDSGNYQAFIHDGTKMKKIPGMGGDTKGYDINIHGHVVGAAWDADGGRHAFLYKDGKIIDLYALLPEADKANWKELREGFSISDDGVIVGRGRYWRNKAEKKNSSMAFRLKL